MDYKINLQDGKHMWDNGDYANERLFTYVDPCVFERRTYKLFMELLDNYERGVRHYSLVMLCGAFIITHIS